MQQQDLVRLVVGGHRIIDEPAFQYFLHGILIYRKDGIALPGFPCLEPLVECRFPLLPIPGDQPIDQQVKNRP